VGVLAGTGAAPAVLHAQTDPYVEGKLLLADDDWVQALEVWERGAQALARRGEYDPRIGVAYIEVATEHQATGFYETASELFVQGFSGTNMERYEPAVIAEAQRILPLLDPDDDDDEVPVWEEMIKKRDPALIRRIKRFWIEKDPTPGTAFNERLIEHWERIAYARRNFTLQKDSPYDTDDRGTIYVKYGPPDKSQAGIMGADDFELRVRTPNNGGSRFADTRRELRRYDFHPQYEVWGYDELNGQDVTWFLFGNYEATGPFRLLKSPRELIHPSAWSPSSRNATPGNVKAAYYMELFIYGELAKIGGPYARRHSQLETYWDRMQGAQFRLAPNEESLEAFSLRFKQEDDFGPEYPAEVAVISDYEGPLREMELVATATRVLEGDEPRLIITALSSPRSSLPGVRALERYKLDDGTIRHTLIVRDEALNEVGRINERVSSETGDISTFTLRHIARPMHFTVLGEIVCCGEDRRRDRRLYPGQAHFMPGPPLSTDPAHLEISDVVTGLPIPDEFDPADLVFPLVPSRTVWRRDPLRVYLEAYHLQPAADGVHRMRADFRLVRVEGQREILDLDHPPVTLTVDLESQAPVAKRVFDINVRDQVIGHYRLEVTITDLVSGESKTRQVGLHLIQ